MTEHGEGGDEIVHGYDEYTAEELLEQCQGNAASMLLATLTVLAERGISREQWAAGVSSVFARAWVAEEAWQPAPFLDALLTNFRSLGATVETADLADKEPQATISGYPDDALAEVLGVERAHGDAMFHVAASLAQTLGLSLSWQRDRETGRVTLRVHGGRSR